MKTINKETFLKKLGAFKGVRNAPSRNGYGTAPNQFIIQFKNGRILQSYNTIVCGELYGKSNSCFVTSAHDYSTTTSRFVGQFLGMNLNERRKAIKDGTLMYYEIND